MLQSISGTYQLVCHANRTRNIRIGARGLLPFKAGYYLYVGSAFGPGGVNARLGRHLRKHKSKHWHIDYLTAQFKPKFAIVCYEHRRFEHDWASLLEEREDLETIQGFGNSDCKCSSHLFFSETPLDQAALVSSLVGDVELVEL